MEFNHDSRKRNVLRSSVVNIVCKIFQIIANFGYRLFFLRLLTVEYLGLNELFRNILGILCLADLGISAAIVYRLYRPINMEDGEKVGQLIRFYRRAYITIALIITALGGIAAPFLKFLVIDAAEIPPDINLYVVYLLFLAETVSSYLFSYKFSILDADQKTYQNTLISTISIVAKSILQLVILSVTRNYTLTLGSGIAANILINYLAGRWVSHQYPKVFSVSSDVSMEERKAFYKDTSATLLHKVGTTIVTSTDNILLTKYIGLAIAGIYANYAMVIGGIAGIINIALFALGPSLGNAHASLEPEQRYQIYKKLLFLNFWIIGLVSAGLYVLIDDFIFLWLGDSFLLDRWTVILLCIQFFIQGARCVSGLYTNACGLFVRDKARPIIEAVLNLGISIVFLKAAGVPGVIIGTIASCMLTAFWREPYLLYRYIFKRNAKEYWLLYAKYAMVTICAAVFSAQIKALLFSSAVSVAVWIVSGIITVGIFELFHFIVFPGNQDFRYYINLIRRK